MSMATASLLPEPMAFVLALCELRDWTGLARTSDDRIRARDLCRFILEAHYGAQASARMEMSAKAEALAIERVRRVR